MSSYRPISLFPTISKIFERVIHDQMYEYFKNFNNLLVVQQYGFRKKHSTEYASKKNIDHVNLSKAFHTLTFDILPFK